MIHPTIARYPRTLLAVLAAVLLTFGLAGCGGGDDDYGAYGEAETEDHAATDEYGAEGAGETAGYEEPMTEGAMDDGTMAGDVATLEIANVNDDPDAWIDRSVQGEVEVSDRELTDRGFWVEQDGEELFALVVDEPEERPIHIEKGQRLHLSEATLKDADQAGQVAGRALDQDTQRILDEQEVFLLVRQNSIQVVGQATARGA